MKKNWFQMAKKIALAMGIVVLLNVFFNVGVDTFMQPPEYEDFCQDRTLLTQEACLEAEGEWVEDPVDESYGGWCENHCWERYEEALEPYNRNAFIVLVGLGVLVLAAAMFVAMPAAVMNGLLYGGILSVVIGTMRYWENMDDYLRFIVSGLGLLILIAIGYKKLND